MIRPDRTTHRSRTRRLQRLAGLALIALLASASAIDAQRSARGAEATGPAETATARAVPLVRPDRISPEIAEWAERTTQNARGPHEKLTALLEGLLGQNGLAIRYDASYTGTAEEVFESRKANCLSFTHLFVAAARQVGVSTYYVTVDEIESYAKRGDLVVISNHITAGFGPPHERTLLDFTVRPDVDYQSARRVTDERAHALYYSNRGAELMQQGEHEAAVDQFILALGLDDQLAEAWSNLGVARRRLGDREAAAAAYARAIEAESSYFPVYQNLLALYQLEGREDAAQELIRLLDRRSNRNPFSYLALGDVSLQADRPEQAYAFYRRARKLDKKGAEPAAALGQLELLRGDRRAAERWLERAQSANAENPRVRDLAMEMSGEESRLSGPEGESLAEASSVTPRRTDADDPIGPGDPSESEAPSAHDPPAELRHPSEHGVESSGTRQR